MPDAKTGREMRGFYTRTASHSFTKLHQNFIKISHNFPLRLAEIKKAEATENFPK